MAWTSTSESLAAEREARQNMRELAKYAKADVVVDSTIRAAEAFNALTSLVVFSAVAYGIWWVARKQREQQERAAA